MYCKRCDNEIGATNRCVRACDVVFPDGTRLAALPYRSASGDTCRDCGVIDGVHHQHCWMEECPRCGCQLVSCDCKDSEGDQ
jgi:hypothetical protein